MRTNNCDSMIETQQAARIGRKYFRQFVCAQTRVLDDADRMFNILLAFLAETKWIVGAKYNLPGTEHFCNAGNDRFMGWSRGIVIKFAKVMARFALTLSFAKGALDSRR